MSGDAVGFPVRRASSDRLIVGRIGGVGGDQ